MFDRILKIQNEMIRLAILIEQKVEPDPLEIIANKLVTDDECNIPDNFLKANLPNENAVHAPEPKPERVAPSS
jgi:hypothetical protein